MNDLISVIVPIYKVEDYLDRCVQSIVNQIYDRLEIILVDDGSPDHCPQICDAWAKKDKRIKVIHKKNGGLSDARNVGIVASSGDYITFVDSDDCINEQFILKLYTQIQKTKSQIACVGMQLFRDEKEIAQDIVPGETVVYSRKEAMAELFEKSKFQNYVCNKMFESKLFESIKFPCGRVMEDIAVTYKLIDRCQSVSYCSEELYYYYQRSDSIMGGSNERWLKDWYLSSKERYLYLCENYPGLDANYRYFNNVVLLCYPVLTEEESSFAVRELKRNRKYGMNDLNWKTTLRLGLFLLNKRLYCAMWKVWQKNKRKGAI